MTKQKKSKDMDCVKRKDIKKIKKELRAEFYKNIWNFVKGCTGVILLFIWFLFIGVIFSMPVLPFGESIQLLIFFIGLIVILLGLPISATLCIASMEN